MIKLLPQDGETFRHGFRKMFVVLQGLQDGNLRGETVSVVFDGETDDFVHAESDVLGFHVLF